MPNVRAAGAVNPVAARPLTNGRLIACNGVMSPSKPPRRGAPHAPSSSDPNAAEPRPSDGANAWASYDEADDWSLTGEVPSHRREPTGVLVPTAGHKPQAVPDGYFLVPVDGAEEGKNIPLRQTPTTVGRSADNDVVLPDSNMSRAHAVLTYSEASWQVRDLGSGNGVFVNGQRVQMATVAPGDLVAFGQIPFTFAHKSSRVKAVSQVRAPPPQSAVPVQQPPPSQGAVEAVSPLKTFWRPARMAHLWARPKRVVGAIALAALAGVWVNSYINHTQAQAAGFARCAAGITAFGAQDWDVAEQAFSDAQHLAPGHALTGRYQAALLHARRDAATLADGSERRQQGDLGRARAALLALSGTSLTDEASKEAQAYGSAVTQVALQAEAALAAGLGVEAASLLQSLGDPLPKRYDVSALSAWAAQRSQNVALEDAAKVRSQRAQRIPSLWDQAQTQSPAMRASIRAFRRGTAQTGPLMALRIMRQPVSRAERALVVALKRFNDAYATALIEHRGKRAFAAIKLFVEARGQAIKVAGEGSQPARDVDEKLADMYYVLGVQALMAGQLAEAAEALRTAVARQPGHALSMRKLNELEERADRMVDEAEFMVQSHGSRAQELLRQVVQAMPANAPASVRARKVLQGIAPAH
jgi:hypothetical protein